MNAANADSARQKAAYEDHPNMGTNRMSRLQGMSHQTRLQRNVLVSLAVGLTIAASGSIPYYYPDLIIGSKIDVLFRLPSALFMVGLVIGTILGSNVHDVSLVFGIIINWLIFGAIAFVILTRLRPAPK